MTDQVHAVASTKLKLIVATSTCAAFGALYAYEQTLPFPTSDWRLVPTIAIVVSLIIRFLIKRKNGTSTSKAFTFLCVACLTLWVQPRLTTTISPSPAEREVMYERIRQENTATFVHINIFRYRELSLVIPLQPYPFGMNSWHMMRQSFLFAMICLALAYRHGRTPATPSPKTQATREE